MRKSNNFSQDRCYTHSNSYLKIEGEKSVTQKAFQDCYPEEYAHCFGCGFLNNHGLQIKSYWDGEESVCRYQPPIYYTGGYPNNVYGGFIASLIDCHSAATASAAILRDQGLELETSLLPRCVTASLKVDYRKPTPVDTIIELRSRVIEIKGRKVIVSTIVTAGGEMRAEGHAIMVRLPDETKV
jgi:acyl-coenzyme A thioesterase PaaI-like protein